VKIFKHEKSVKPINKHSSRPFIFW